MKISFIGLFVLEIAYLIAETSRLSTACLWESEIPSRYTIILWG